MPTSAYVPDEVHEQAQSITDDRDMTVKEAYRHVFREAGYDV